MATEVPLGNLDQPSVVVSNLIQTLSWKDRKAKLIAEAEYGVLGDVLVRLVALIGAEEVIEQFITD